MLSVVFCSILFTVLCFEYRAEAAAQGTLRFYRHYYVDSNQAWSSGIVEIYYSGSWGNICDDGYFGLSEASVICHQLSYSGASTYTNTGLSSLYGTDTKSTALEGVSCTYSSYLSITQCSFDSAYTTYCASDTQDVIVSCYTSRIWNYPTTGDIRLVNGTYSNQGLLEVYCNGEWGTVCSYGFGSTEATVACRQLGYNDYYRYNHLSLKGTSSQKIWLSDFTDYCSSYSTCLTVCEWCPTSRVTSCSHYQDMTLECEYSSYGDSVFTDTSDTCDYEDYDYSDVSSAVIIGSVVGSIVFLIICALIIGVPICICCCLGFGIGAASSRSRPRSTVVCQPIGMGTTTVVATSQQQQQQQQKPDQQTTYYPPPPPPYSSQPAQPPTGYIKLQEEYPPQY